MAASGVHMTDLTIHNHSGSLTKATAKAWVHLAKAAEANAHAITAIAEAMGAVSSGNVSGIRFDGDNISHHGSTFLTGKGKPHDPA